MTLSYQVERISDLFEEIEPLWRRHWQEIGLNHDKVPLDPDYRRYREMDAQGILSTVTVRQDGRLVGYSIFVVFPALHYKSTLEATNDIFWIAPESRNGVAGKRLFRAVECELKRRGVKRMMVGSKLHRDSSPLFLALKYQPIEMWFCKLLGD